MERRKREKRGNEKKKEKGEERRSFTVCQCPLYDVNSSMNILHIVFRLFANFSVIQRWTHDRVV